MLPTPRRILFYIRREADAGILHFSTRNRNVLLWTEPAQLASRLRNRIEAVLGRPDRKQLI